MDFEIVRGTTKKVKYVIFNEDGSVYELQDGDKLILGVKNTESDSAYLIKKIMTKSNKTDNGYLISFIPEDTQNLKYGTYHYDIGVQTKSGEYYMTTEYSTFIIKKAITQKE